MVIIEQHLKQTSQFNRLIKEMDSSITNLYESIFSYGKKPITYRHKIILGYKVVNDTRILHTGHYILVNKAFTVSNSAFEDIIHSTLLNFDNYKLFETSITKNCSNVLGQFDGLKNYLKDNCAGFDTTYD